MDTKGAYYLGRIFDQKTGKTSQEALLYDPEDLTTHAVVVGMTGSGKTGLCMDLLEEAALNGLPVLAIDPKGDITNELLHFPELLPQDFQPWVNPDKARQANQSLEQYAAETAAKWRKGLNDWSIGPERMRQLTEKACYAIYTPGSDAGLAISILASLKAPALDWGENRELLREKISATVTALLSLVGLEDIDPVRSREHILLANIFEYAWSQGRDLDLSELILQTQSPPFPKLGVFDVNTFFPEKDRFSLAMLLNNILAAPAFQAWIEGQPLDIPSLLHHPDGRPRHSVFYIAHLTDTERMFFVTLLFSAVEAWMRAQSGSTTLRALLYFDEIFGYMPPVKNPPSKPVMLRLLKQARAFGLGLVLVTQNPVDLDYKGLSNTGTWFIGKLQTDNDKQRLLDGLQGVQSGSMDRNAYDKLIAGLGQRVFLMHNIHNPAPALFQTRWAMNFLAGPLTRSQVPSLNRLVGAEVETVLAPTNQAAPTTQSAGVPAAPGKPATAVPPVPKVTPPVATVAAAGAGTSTRPILPTGIKEYFLPYDLTLAQALRASGEQEPTQAASLGLVYRPVLYGQASIRVLDRRYDLDEELLRTVLVAAPDRRGSVRWENYAKEVTASASFDQQPAPQARFASTEAPLTDLKLVNAMQKDFLDWAYQTTEVQVRANEALKVYAGPSMPVADFRRLCDEAASQGREAEIEKISAAYDKKIEAIVTKMEREQRELDGDEAELSNRTLEELGTHAETLFGLLGKRKSSRRISSSLSKRRMTSQAKADVQESKKAIEAMKKQIAELEEEKQREVQEVEQRWSKLADQEKMISIAPTKQNVRLEAFGVAWAPFHTMRAGDEQVELPASSVLVQANPSS
jgi:hypothetical protein